VCLRIQVSPTHFGTRDGASFCFYWATLSMYIWRRRQNPVSEASYFEWNTGRWIMSRIAIVILIYHRHKPIDSINLLGSWRGRNVFSWVLNKRQDDGKCPQLWELYSRNSQNFMENAFSLPCSQQQATVPCYKPNKSDPDVHPLSLKCILMLSYYLLLGLVAVSFL
jgi:hypothetical protein